MTQDNKPMTTDLLMIRALAAFWRSIETNAPQSMYHALDENIHYDLQSAAVKAINQRLTGNTKGIR